MDQISNIAELCGSMSTSLARSLYYNPRMAANRLLENWLSRNFKGEIVGSWCKKISGVKDWIVCSYCKTMVNITPGYESLRKHALTQKHIKKKKKISTLKAAKKHTHLESIRRDPTLSWCRQIYGLKNMVLCLYCRKALPSDDLTCLRGHALSDRHQLRTKLLEHKSLRVKPKVTVKPRYHPTAPVCDEVKYSLCLEAFPNQLSSLSCNGLNSSSDVKQADKLSEECKESMSSYTSCYVPLIPLSVQEWTPIAPRSSSCLAQPRIKQGSSLPEVFMCFYCHREFTSTSDLQAHLFICQDMRKCWKPPQQPSDVYIEPSVDAFMASVRLLPKETALAMTRERSTKECESIDLEDDSPHPQSLPWTPKRLLSHLSHDGSNLHTPVKRRPSLSSYQARTECFKTPEKGNESAPSPQFAGAKSLYSIDLTSTLGCLVRKQVKGDPKLHVLSDVESHCLTTVEKRQPSFYCNLRQRPVNFPLTFKEHSSKYCHQYKFNRRQKSEFIAYVNTGLNKASRHLLRSMKRCSVKLNPLTKADLHKWMPSRNNVKVVLKPLTIEEIHFWTKPKSNNQIQASFKYVQPEALFPKGFSLKAPALTQVLGLQTKSRQGQRKSNYIFVDSMSERDINKSVLLKSLLSDAETENVPTTVSPIVPRETGYVPSGSSLQIPVAQPSKQCGGSQGKMFYLPDITNLNVDRDKVKTRLCFEPFNSLGNPNTIPRDHFKIKQLSKSTISLNTLPRSSDSLKTISRPCHLNTFTRSSDHFLTLPSGSPNSSATFGHSNVQKSMKNTAMYSGVKDVCIRIAPEGEMIHPINTTPDRNVKSGKAFQANKLKRCTKHSPDKALQANKLKRTKHSPDKALQCPSIPSPFQIKISCHRDNELPPQYTSTLVCKLYDAVFPKISKPVMCSPLFQDTLSMIKPPSC
ncbi:uncharacterized protein LOC106077577 isoform X3 [Biomphalaria glabrata]|uniref:Uncharacterized protein LOC106077577 isoform X3 n=1 Tax=Biomphalaria glabrata TaxID=6526 RepID=A0A9W3A4N2_BIOGL|nr:uncharacterized protein LOC106077577 isoform X3 [Biomphalaria glabrata]